MKHNFLTVFLAASLPAFLHAASELSWDGGDGAWNAENLQWEGGTLAWHNDANSGDVAVFSAAAGTVTLDSGGVRAGGLRFARHGYKLTGGTLDFGFAQGTIDTSGMTGKNDDATISSALAGTGGLTISAHGNMTFDGGASGADLLLEGDNSGLSGGISITRGLVRFGTITSAGPADGLITLNGGGVNGRYNLNLPQPISLGPDSGTFRVWSGRTLTLSGTISGEGGFVKTDSGALLLAGDNTFQGSAEILNGNVRLASPTALGSADGRTVIGGRYATLDLNGFSISDEPLTWSADHRGKLSNSSALPAEWNGPVALSDSAGTVEVSKGDLHLGGEITGSKNLEKTGGGTLLISALSDDHTGGIIVSAGRLLLTGRLGSEMVTVKANASIEGGGTILGDLDLAGGSTITLSVGGPALTVEGLVTFGAGFGFANLKGLDWDNLETGVPYQVIDSNQDFSVAGLDNFGAENAAPVGGGDRKAYFTNGLSVVIVPEPGTLLLCGLALLPALRRRR